MSRKDYCELPENQNSTASGRILETGIRQSIKPGIFVWNSWEQN
ncbi:hypothetical protein GCWU000341_02749 [Oribacterium sp. oral taxon 078 str. F0262]|nr:hypothetical protein GCWU000341_02749 [Oribacterium sp. oral taxon 078 str. F0262]